MTTRSTCAAFAAALWLGCMSGPSQLDGGPRLVASGHEVSFAAGVEDATPPAPGHVGLYNAGGGVLALPEIEFFYDGIAGGWLAAAVTSSGSGFDVAFTAPGAVALPGGTYLASVRLQSPGAVGAPVIVNVTLTVKQARFLAERSPLPLRCRSAPQDPPPDPVVVPVDQGDGSLVPGPAVRVEGGAASEWVAAAMEGGGAVRVACTDAGTLRAGTYRADVVLVSDGLAVARLPVELEERRSWRHVDPGPMNPGIFTTSAALPDGRVLTAGIDPPALFDPATETWTATRPMVIPRLEPALAALPDGRVLAAGGSHYDGDWVEEDSWELYDPAADTWTLGGHLRIPRARGIAVLLDTGEVLLLGGWPWSRAGERLDPSTAASTVIPGGTNAYDAVRLPSGRVLIVTDYGSPTTYDPETNTLAPTSPLVQWSAWRRRLALLADGRVLCAGGGVYEGDQLVVDAPAEVYDPERDRWTVTGKLAPARAYDSNLLALPDGKVLVAGGGGTVDGESSTASTELYDPATGTWSSAEPLRTPSGFHQLVSLPGDRVLLIPSNYSWHLGWPQVWDRRPPAPAR